MPPGVVRISLLGPVTMSIAGRAVDLPGNRIRVLLATLAVAAGTPLPTDQLAEQVWTDRPPVHLRQSVHTLVTRLRRVIGADRIRTTGDGYVLAVDPADVDALVFEEWLRCSAALDGAAAVDATTDALALWAGPPERSTLDWADDLRAERLIELYVGAVERRVDLELRTEGLDPQNSLPTLRDLATRFPLRETLWARLIRVLDAAGRKAEALEAYERVRVRISDELGVDPGLELTSLHAKLLATDVPLTISPAADNQADGPRQLPLDIPHFTGREEVLAVLDEFAAGPATLVAIDGPGGVGKTTVAVHWAHSALARFPGGQVFLNLRGYSAGGPLRPEQALAILLGSVGVPQERIPDDPDARAALWRSTVAKRDLVLILARGGRYRLELLGAPLDGVRGLEFGTAEDALTWFRREVLALLTAVRAGVEWGHPRLAAALASCLGDVLELDKTADESIVETFAIGRRAAAESGDRALEAFVGNQHGIALRLAGRDRDSVVVLHEVADLFDAIGETSGAAMVRCNLGIAYDELGEPERAIEQLTLALDGAEDMDRAQALNNLAFLYLGMGQGGEAVRTAKAAVDLTRARGWERGLYYCVDTLGQAYQANGELDGAITSLAEAARMAEEQKIGAAEVRTLTALGRAYHAADRLTEARQSWQQALLVAERTGPTHHFDVGAIQRLLDETA